METNIKVETVGYYHRDSNFAATPDLPLKRINENRRYFEKKTPFLNLNLEVSDVVKSELKLESFIDYIRQKGWPNEEKPDFVTDRRLLTYIASFSKNIKVHIYRMAGIIFIVPIDTVYHSSTTNFSVVFKHFLTRTSDDQPIGNDGIIRKAVLKATIQNRGSDSYSILYGAQVAAADDENEHYELKVLTGSLYNNLYFWKNKSCAFYWQSVFGNVPNIIAGIRTTNYPRDPKTREPLNYPELSVFKIEQLKTNAIPSKVKQHSRNPKNPFTAWTVSEGETNLRNFLKLVKDTVKSDGDCFVFSRNDKYSEWIINRDEETVGELRDVVLENIPV